jgi:hypothetical protein
MSTQMAALTSAQVEEFVRSYAANHAFRNQVRLCEEGREVLEPSIKLVVGSPWYLENRCALDLFARLIGEKALSRLRREFPTFLKATSELIGETYDAFICENALPMSNESTDLGGSFFQFAVERAKNGKLNSGFDINALFRDRAHKLLMERAKREGATVCLVRIDRQLLWIEECRPLMEMLNPALKFEVFYVRANETGIVHKVACEGAFFSRVLDSIEEAG